MTHWDDEALRRALERAAATVEASRGSRERAERTRAEAAKERERAKQVRLDHDAIAELLATELGIHREAE